MIYVSYREFDEILNSARKMIDFKTILYMVIVNINIKVVVRKIFLISAMIVCNCKNRVNSINQLLIDLLTHR